MENGSLYHFTLEEKVTEMAVDIETNSTGFFYLYFSIEITK